MVQPGPRSYYPVVVRSKMVLEMTSDDPGSDPDMKVWARRSGHDLLEVSRDGAVFRFRVRKTR